MGRRALRKIDPALDLSSYFKTFDELPNPWDSKALFQDDAPLAIDVGCGKGLFTFGAASAVPDCNWLGIEVSRKYARYSAARLARHGLCNGVIVEADAQRVFAELLPASSVSEVHVYFPDPWWKKRHKKRRVMNPALLKDVERVLVSSGRLHFWTDVEEYFQTGSETVAESTQLVGPLPVNTDTPLATIEYRTNFERRTRMHDEPVYAAEWQKTNAATPAHP